MGLLRKPNRALSSNPRTQFWIEEDLRFVAHHWNLIELCVAIADEQSNQPLRCPPYDHNLVIYDEQGYFHSIIAQEAIVLKF